MDFVRYIGNRWVVLVLTLAIAGTAISAGAAPYHRGDDPSGVVSDPALPPLAARASAPEIHVLANGLRIRLFTEECLRSRRETLDGQAIIRLDEHRYVPVITSTTDPAIYNKGDGSFHAFPRAMTLSALNEISHPNAGMEVTVYILPFPRKHLLVSSTSGNEIFLSPHVLDIHPAVGAYIVAHEMGHVFHNACLPEGSRGWTKYRHLRGIDNTARFNDGASHAYRPHEIFAEDFRVLFGGSLAAFGGSIENPELATPLSVTGLRSFMIALGQVAVVTPEVIATSYPNPFNPATEIRVDVPAGVVEANQPVTVRIYNVRGSLVRELFAGSTSSGELQLRWDGTDRRGERVASANYYALVTAGDARATLKLVLLK